MAGYDRRNSNASLDFMARRFGVYRPDAVMEQMKENLIPVPPNIAAQALDGVHSQEMRFAHNGGYLQQERMIYDKKRSLDRALLYSYQGASIRKVSWVTPNELVESIDDREFPKICRALINPNKNKPDYDEKVLSVPYEADYHPGDVFEWIGTGTYWIIYLQELTELAYFRGDIRKCQYQINWEDEDGQHSTYCAVRGPVETKINYIQKHGISVDNPNYSLNILLPRTEEILKYFRRYSKFYLKGADEGSQEVCWRVEAIDWISTPGILEVNATEYYSNEFEDDVANGIVGGLILDKVSPNGHIMDYSIDGEVFIKPRKQYNYVYTGLPIQGVEWQVEENKPVKFLVNPDNPLQIGVMWTSPYSGQFTIRYGQFVKTVVVESLMS